MDIKKCMEITQQYYSKWLGQDDILLHDFKGIEYLYSKERNRALYGYGVPFDLYVLRLKERVVISYGDKAGDKVEILKGKISIDMSAEKIRQVLESVFERKASHSMKYVLTRLLPITEARAQVVKDYKKYESFWLKCHPESADTGWLKDYFDEMAKERMCIGIFIDDELISCTDAPGIPYMESEVQEIGINTLPEYRGMGYASMACEKCLHEIIDHGKAPQWSAAIDNKASQRLAEKIGFDEFAEAVSITL